MERCYICNALANIDGEMCDDCIGIVQVIVTIEVDREFCIMGLD